MSEAGCLSWPEVLALHGTRRGIRGTPPGASILFDVGLSPYRNRRDGARLHYQGEGSGDQAPEGGNAVLLRCQEGGLPVQVFERLRPGCWRDLGPHSVTGCLYQPSGGRMAFEFLLEPRQV